MTLGDCPVNEVPTVIVGVSLKSYFGYQQTLDWCEKVSVLPAWQATRASGQLEFFVLPALPLILPARDTLLRACVRVGAQTVSGHPNGAHTGEVSAATLAEIGCTHALIGHAERRAACAETDAVIARQFAATLSAGLCPVLCVGEPVRASKQDAARFCREQVSAALTEGTGHPSRQRIIVAYEPVWAIGADQPAPDDHVAYVCAELTRQLDDAQSGAFRGQVIYGGAAGPGQLARLYGPVSGLFMGRFAHQVSSLAAVFDDAMLCLAAPHDITRFLGPADEGKG
jgi:triosephosphate isomerase